MTRRAPHVFGRLLGVVASIISAFSFYAAFAPFTAAIVLHLITIPMAAAAILLGSWRSGIFSMYWSCCAAASLVIGWEFPNIDLMLVFGFIGGGVLILLLLIHYFVSKKERPAGS